MVGTSNLGSWNGHWYMYMHIFLSFLLKTQEITKCWSPLVQKTMCFSKETLDSHPSIAANNYTIRPPRWGTYRSYFLAMFDQCSYEKKQKLIHPLTFHLVYLILDKHKWNKLCRCWTGHAGSTLRTLKYLMLWVRRTLRSRMMERPFVHTYLLIFGWCQMILLMLGFF